MILLDTDHFSALEYAADAAATQLRGRLRSSGDPEVATTIVTFEEEMRGWLARIHGEHDPLRQVSAYRRLLQLAVAFRTWQIVPFEERSAREFTGLRSRHRRLGAQDLKIAAIALTNNALLLSANLRDFRHISGLRVENWLAIPASGGRE